MKAPDIAYRYIQAIDTASPTFEIVSREFVVSASATAVTFSLMGIPGNRVMVLSNLIVVANPGAAQSVIDLNVQFFTGAGQAVDIIHQRGTVTADLTEAMPWQGEIYIPGRGTGNATITVAVNFSAAVAANQIFGGIHGIVIPRGNVAAF